MSEYPSMPSYKPRCPFSLLINASRNVLVSHYAMSLFLSIQGSHRTEAMLTDQAVRQ